MSDNGSEQNVDSTQAGKADECGPGCNCNCGTTGSGNKWKTIICLIIVIAAGAVLAQGFERKAESKASQAKESSSVTAPGTSATPAEPKGAEAKVTKSSSWGKPLRDLASLNEVAADSTAVMVYLAEKGQKPSQVVKRNIEQAANKSTAKGMSVSYYTLDDSSQDYAQITSQAPAPCVLVMAKGCGASAVSGDITEEKLLAAIVTASRPSSCGPSGCGPSGCGPSSSGCN